MSHLRILRFAGISWLALFSIVANAQAQVPFTSNVATDWLSTYSTTTAMSHATSASWGNPANAGGTGIWSAGSLSWDWTNVRSSTYNGVNYNILPTYYNANTVGYLNSGATQVATYTYTVPFQAYQFNPGQTNQVAVGPVLTQQVTHTTFKDTASAITLPTGWTVSSNTTTSGTIQQIGAVKELTNSGNVQGFTTTAWSISSTFNNGSQAEQSSVPGVFYNYGANATSAGLAAPNVPSSAGDPIQGIPSPSYSTVTLNPSLGPTYVAWTSPNAGTININLNAWDTGMKADDGTPGFYVMTSTGGPTAPLLSAINFNVGNTSNFLPFTGNMSATQGTLTALTGLSGYTGASGNGPGYGLHWVSGNITVTSGEVIYFVADPSHTAGPTSLAYEGGQNPIALNDVITFTPEPSSFVLMGLSGVGLALAAWKRRRVAYAFGRIDWMQRARQKRLPGGTRLRSRWPPCGAIGCFFCAGPRPYHCGRVCPNGKIRRSEHMCGETLAP